jgi:hypothetical protein
LDLQISGSESESEASSLPVILKINVVKLIGRRWGFTALPLVLFFPKGKRNKSVKKVRYSILARLERWMANLE